MGFRFRCLKCGSTSIYVDQDSRISWEGDKILRCYTCGWALYGKEKAEAAAKIQYAAFLKEKRADQVHRAEVARKRAIYDINAWERRHKEAQQTLISKGLCASIDCDNGSALARKSSIYCSRQCCVHNAHRRERERRYSRRAQADIAA